MTIDLDKIEALARAALPVSCKVQDGIIPTSAEDETAIEYLEATSPTIVLQWIGETRELEAERNRLNNAAIDQSKEASSYADKLRMAVEALEYYQKWCTCRGFGDNECGAIIADEFAYTATHKKDCAALVARTALATLSAPTGDKVK